MSDPFAPEALEDPYPLYDALRVEQPVFEVPGTGVWMVTRHADVVEACARPDVFSSHISAIVYAGGGPSPVVLAADPDAIGAVDVLATQDPPVHTAQRKLMNRSFVHARIAALEPAIDAWMRDALARTDDEVEWMSAVANPLPVHVISTLLGLPESDAADLKRWADAGVDLLGGAATPERLGECWQEMIAFLDYLRARLADPAPGSITADVAEAPELTDNEAVSLMLQLVIAGSESTASLIGTAARALASDPALQRAVREDRGLLPGLLEECVRLESPFRGHFRVTTQPVTLGGVSLPEGARVMLMWGSANRDPAVIQRPATLDPARAHPKQHLAFGSGIHFCIGAPLARLEARLAITALLDATTEVALAGVPSHVPSLFVRRLERLPLRLVRG